MNKVILVGRLTKDVELRYTQTNNTAVATFTLAVDRKPAKLGEERKSDFFNIVAWSKLADIATNYLSKGVRVGIVGYIQNRYWENAEGTKKCITEIITEDIEFLDTRKKEETDINVLIGTSESDVIPNIQIEDNNDDLPF